MGNLRENRVIKIGSFLLSLAMVFLMMPKITFAAGDISATNVTGITVNRGAIEGEAVGSGAKIKVTLSFSEDAQGAKDIENGDTITVSWPTKDTTTGRAYLKGAYSSNIPLTLSSDSSVVIGYATVRADGAVITFNENVEKYQHVKGYLNFEAYAGTKDNNTAPAETYISSGSQKQSVWVHGNGEGPVGFSTKSGAFVEDKDHNVDYTRAEWWIPLNRTMKNLTGTVTLVDKMPKSLTGYEFKYISRYSADGNVRDGAGGDQSCRTWIENHGGTVTWDTTKDDYNELTITLPASAFKVDGKACQIHFGILTDIDATKVTDDQIRNAIVTTYTAEGEGEKTENHSSTLQYANSSAGAEGVPKGTIQITKVVNGTQIPINGVTFKVEKLTGENGTPVENWYTDANGQKQSSVNITTDENDIARLADLDDGYYRLSETTGPDWVVTTTQAVVVKLGGEHGVDQVIENKIKTTDITAAKIWEDSASAGLPHPTIYFKLYRAVGDGEAEPVEGAELKKLENGTTQVTWTGLPVANNSGEKYTYSVKEVDENGNDYVPDNYTKEENGLTVTNTEGITPPDENPQNPTPDDNTPSDDNPAKVTTPGASPAGAVPTGDDASMLSAGIMAATAAAAAICALLRRRRTARQ